jgi:predicted PurR-regulated permease PerM
MIQKLPITAIRSIELLGLVLLAIVIYHLQNIIMPMLMALVVSIALLPFYRYLVRKKNPSSISIFLTMFLMLTALVLILLFIASQLKPLIYNFDTIRLNIINHINDISIWLSNNTSISTTEQTEIIKQQANIFLDSAGNYFKDAIGSISKVIIFFGLFPIYTFLILYYKNVLKKFLLMWFKPAENLQVSDTIKNIESIIHSYIVGLMIQFVYMTILLGGALLLFGIKYALLIAVIFAVLNLIPYIGAFIGNIIGILLTLSSSPSIGDVFTVVIVITVVQFLDGNILMPSIVGSKIRINALASLFGVFIGGMFLSLPLMASFKIVFDHTEKYKKWGVLLGDERPTTNISKIFRKR